MLRLSLDEIQNHAQQRGRLMSDDPLAMPLGRPHPDILRVLLREIRIAREGIDAVDAYGNLKYPAQWRKDMRRVVTQAVADMRMRAADRRTVVQQLLYSNKYGTRIHRPTTLLLVQDAMGRRGLAPPPATNFPALDSLIKRRANRHRPMRDQ